MREMMKAATIRRMLIIRAARADFLAPAIQMVRAVDSKAKDRKPVKPAGQVLSMMATIKPDQPKITPMTENENWRSTGI
jgi:hypothetical protein